MLSWDTLQLLRQKVEGEFVQPGYLAEIARLFDPRRGGSVEGTLVGINPAQTNIVQFVVPRSGLYFIRARQAALAGAVIRVRYLFNSNLGVGMTDERVVSVSQGTSFEGLYLLEADDTLNIQNIDAMIAGDQQVASIVNYEVALT